MGSDPAIEQAAASNCTYLANVFNLANMAKMSYNIPQVRLQKMKAKLQPRRGLKLANQEKARRRARNHSESVLGSSELETYIPASEAKNRFASVLECVSKGQQVFITKHNSTKAVVMSVERYRLLSAATTSLLDKLTAEFDARFERMQTPAVRLGMQKAFDATPDKLAKSAVKAARARS